MEQVIRWNRLLRCNFSKAFLLIVSLSYALQTTASPAFASRIDLSVSEEKKRIYLDAKQATRESLFHHLAEKTSIHWSGKIPSPKETVTIRFSNLSIEKALQKILAPASFILVKANEYGNPEWRLYLLSPNEPALERFPLASEILAELKQLGEGQTRGDTSTPVLEEMVFYRLEQEVYQILDQAINSEEASIRRGARALLEDLGPTWVPS